MSMMEADDALSRDAYAMSHWLGVVDTRYASARLLPAAGSMQAGLAAATADGQQECTAW